MTSTYIGYNCFLHCSYYVTHFLVVSLFHYPYLKQLYHITAEDAGDTAEDAAISGGDRSAMLLLVDDDDDFFVEAEPKQTIFFSL